MTEERKTMTMHEVSNSFGGNPNFHHAPTETLGLSDEVYALPTLAEMKELVSEMLANFSDQGIVYRAAVFDCEDQAYMLRALAGLAAWHDGERKHPFPVGIVMAYDPPHAVNVALTSDYGWIVVEAQDGSIFIGEDIKNYIKFIHLALF